MEGSRATSVDEYFRAAGRRRTAARRRVEHLCELCGRPFEGLATARFCSSLCRVRAYRLRHRAPDEGRADLPPLIRRLDATRAAIGRGRVFPDSTAIIRAEREHQSDLP